MVDGNWESGRDMKIQISKMSRRKAGQKGAKRSPWAFNKSENYQKLKTNPIELERLRQLRKMDGKG